MNSCNRLPCAHEVLAVFAHPDDESFGLGAVLGDFTAHLTEVSVGPAECGGLAVGEAQSSHTRITV